MADHDRNRGLSDLFSTASSLLNSSQSHSSTASYGASNQGNPNLSSASQYPKPSRSEIMASAQVVMNVAKAKLQKPSSGSSSSSEEPDMGKLAGAASTLIGAVSSYGKLDEGNYGKYVIKAQDYLHTYEIKHSKPGTAPAPPSQASAYQASQAQGTFQGNSPYTSASAASYGQQSSASYPPAGYADARQSYGYGSQNMPSSSSSNANDEPPLGYPPAGYPTSRGSYPYPTR